MKKLTFDNACKMCTIAQEKINALNGTYSIEEDICYGLSVENINRLDELFVVCMFDIDRKNWIFISCEKDNNYAFQTAQNTSNTAYPCYIFSIEKINNNYYVIENFGYSVVSFEIF